jgi:hypothetical protein
MRKINTNQEREYKLENLVKLTFEFSKQEFETKVRILSSFSLLIGGLVCWLYYSRIKYLPELDIQSLLLIVVGASIVGIILLFLPPYFIIFPGVIWKDLIESDRSIELIFASRSLSYELIKQSNYIKDRVFISRPKISKRRKFFFFIWTFFGDLSLTSCVTAFDSHNSRYGMVLICVFSFMFLTTFFLVLNTEKISKKGFINIFFKSIKIWFYSLYSFCAYMLFWLVLTLSFMDSQRLSNKCYGNFEIIMTFLIIFTVLMLASFFAISDKSKYSWNSYLISLLFFVVLTIYTNNLDAIPNRVMKNYGWGNIDDATILVNFTGCKAIESMGVKLTERCLNQNSVYRVKKVNILSAIGKNYYLSFPGYYPQGDSELLKFTLSSSNIISWSRQSIDFPLPSNFIKKGTCKNS